MGELDAEFTVLLWWPLPGEIRISETCTAWYSDVGFVEMGS